MANVQQIISVDGGGPVSVYDTRPPTITGFYIFSIEDVAGVVAANNFISLFNPIGSGKTVIFGGAFVSSCTAGGSTVTAPLRGYRITAASAGTLQAASASVKFVTTDPNPVAEVRTANPTVTLGSAFFNSPPAISATTASTNVHQVVAPAGIGFTLVPGEGVVLRTTSGDTDQRWNLSIAWGEI